MPSTMLDTIWVCDCCLFAREGDGDGCDGNGGCAGEPWKRIPSGYSVTSGMAFEQHSCGREEVDECECECTSFSWTPCDGCGSTLGGHRHAYTLWRDS